LLYAGRLFMGINAGLNSGLVPIYLTEIAPTSLRGAIGTVYPLILSLTALFHHIISLLGLDDDWKWSLVISAVPAIFQLVTLPFFPESPKHLLLDKDNERAAESALSWLRGTIEVHDEIDKMKEEQEYMKLFPKFTFKQLMINQSFRRPLIISMMMMLAMHLTGGKSNFYYIFLWKAHAVILSEGSSSTSSVILGADSLNVLITFISLVLIDKAGRKPMMITGLCGMLFTTTLILVCDLTLAYDPNVPMSYVSIIAFYLFNASSSVGPSSIPWFYVTELFAQSGRPTATSIAVFVSWSAKLLVYAGYEFHIQLLGGQGLWIMFIVFMVIQVFFIVLVFLVMPETKNKTIEEITVQSRKTSTAGTNGNQWKQGLLNCCGDVEICCCGLCCTPCLTYNTANDMGKSGLLYCLLGCIMPCIPTLLLRQEARERYYIEGDTAGDVGTAVCCTSCVQCQTAVEVKQRGDSR